jgi:hypothetical protein
LDLKYSQYFGRGSLTFRRKNYLHLQDRNQVNTRKEYAAIRIIFSREDGFNILLRNVRELLLGYMTLHSHGPLSLVITIEELFERKK